MVVRIVRQIAGTNSLLSLNDMYMFIKKHVQVIM